MAAGGEQTRSAHAREVQGKSQHFLHKPLEQIAPNARQYH